MSVHVGSNVPFVMAFTFSWLNKRATQSLMPFSIMLVVNKINIIYNKSQFEARLYADVQLNSRRRLFYRNLACILNWQWKVHIIHTSSLLTFQQQCHLCCQVRRQFSRKFLSLPGRAVH